VWEKTLKKPSHMLSTMWDGEDEKSNKRNERKKGEILREVER